MTFAKLNFPILYFYTPLSAQKIWTTCPCILSTKKVHPKKISIACTHTHRHTDTQTHNEYASNDLSEFRRFLPADL